MFNRRVAAAAASLSFNTTTTSSIRSQSSSAVLSEHAAWGHSCLAYYFFSLAPVPSSSSVQTRAKSSKATPSHPSHSSQVEAQSHRVAGGTGGLGYDYALGGTPTAAYSTPRIARPAIIKVQYKSKDYTYYPLSHSTCLAGITHSTNIHSHSFHSFASASSSSSPPFHSFQATALDKDTYRPSTSTSTRHTSSYLHSYTYSYLSRTSLASSESLPLSLLRSRTRGRMSAGEQVLTRRTYSTKPQGKEKEKEKEQNGVANGHHAHEHSHSHGIFGHSHTHGEEHGHGGDVAEALQKGTGA